MGVVLPHSHEREGEREKLQIRLMTINNGKRLRRRRLRSGAGAGGPVRQVLTCARAQWSAAYRRGGHAHILSTHVVSDKSGSLRHKHIIFCPSPPFGALGPPLTDVQIIFSH